MRHKAFGIVPAIAVALGEDRLFGDEGFAKAVEQVAAVAKQLGIYDLSQFTPR
jgi:hypothetical protein